MNKAEQQFLSSLLEIGLGRARQLFSQLEQQKINFQVEPELPSKPDISPERLKIIKNLRKSIPGKKRGAPINPNSLRQQCNRCVIEFLQKHKQASKAVILAHVKNTLKKTDPDLITRNLSAPPPGVNRPVHGVWVLDDSVIKPAVPKLKVA